MVYQLHLLLGIGGSVYLAFVSVTGAVLVSYHAMLGPIGAYGFLSRLHGELLLGRPGLMVSALGGLVLTLMGLTGMAIWWPGIKGLIGSLTGPYWKGPRRFTRKLHRAMGFWSSAFVVAFGITGLILSVPENAVARSLRVVEWFGFNSSSVYRFVRPAVGLLHTGPSEHWLVQALWVVMGFAPLLLTLTGITMWRQHRLASERRKRVRQ